MSDNTQDEDEGAIRFFLFDALMDPPTLQTILRLTKLPEFELGHIKGFHLKKWNGTTATVIEGPGSQQQTVVHGVA